MDEKGYKEITLSDEELGQFYATMRPPVEILENQYLVIKDSKEKVIDKYKFQSNKLKKVNFQIINSTYVGKIKPKNIEQELGFDMLLDKKSTVKLLTGTFGTGKSMSLIGAALQKIEQGEFEKILWVRNNIEVKDTVPLGALPNGEYEKLLPFVQIFADHVGGKEGLRFLVEKEKLEVCHLGFIRGRDIKNSIIMTSEAENLTRQQLQLLIGRVGEGSNLWMDADTRQRDKEIFEKSQGIEILINRLSGNPLFGYINLKKVERSATAQLADLLDI